jgi:Cu2+-exporting ATPase
VLLGDRLEVLAEAVALARRTRAVIRQNLIWAAAYNALVLPLAVTGQLPPYLAAIGMSASSLVVVGNALRLRARREGRLA